jgi:putative nucleotidyltransferase with HDIG domain
MQHPFALSSFKIKDEGQIKTLQGMGLERIRFDPMRSDAVLLPYGAPHQASPGERRGQPPQNSAASDAVTEKNQLLHHAIRNCEKKFTRATKTAREIIKTLTMHPEQATDSARQLVDEMVAEIVANDDVIIQAMDGNRLGDETYYHPLNVTVLSLMMAKSLAIPPEEAKLLGLAALFHDIGKAGVPDSVLMNSGPLSKAEKAMLQNHCQSSAEMVMQAGLPERVAQIILQHHECMDGSGYPNGLKGEEIDPLARVLGLVNAYDRLCNPASHQEAMTPYGALSYLFASERKKYDGTILNLMIKSLGVYPPGSVVQLSDGVYGIVILVNPQKLLRPYIMLHDKRAERHTPSMLDLGAEVDTSISKCVRVDQLPPEVAEYLQCRKKLSYYFSTEGAMFQGETTTV